MAVVLTVQERLDVRCRHRVPATRPGEDYAVGLYKVNFPRRQLAVAVEDCDASGQWADERLVAGMDPAPVEA